MGPLTKTQHSQKIGADYSRSKGTGRGYQKDQKGETGIEESSGKIMRVFRSVVRGAGREFCQKSNSARVGRGKNRIFNST